MKTEPKTTQQQMDEARLTYYRCVAGSHTLFWLVIALYMLGSLINWIFN